MSQNIVSIFAIRDAARRNVKDQGTAIVSIVYEHHENSIGQGFPQRLRDVKMHPLAKVTALADGYANLILPNVNCAVSKNPREALMYIEHTL